MDVEKTSFLHTSNPFFDFSDSLSLGEVIKIYSLPLKRGEGPNYEVKVLFSWWKFLVALK